MVSVRPEILITGASGGLGRALVLEFASNGFNVVATTRSKQNEFVDWCRELQNKTGNQISNECLNLDNAAEAQKQARNITGRFSNVQHFINNAAMASGSTILMTPLAVLRQVYEINFFSQLTITQVFTKHLLHHKQGTITNISSVISETPLPGTFSYGSSKLALEYLTEVLALELSNTNICVSAIRLGMVETEMLNKMDKISKKLLSLKRNQFTALEPEEVARMIFLHIVNLDTSRSGLVSVIEGVKNHSENQSTFN